MGWEGEWKRWAIDANCCGRCPAYISRFLPVFSGVGQTEERQVRAIEEAPPEIRNSHSVQATLPK
jgi:hypothetical protein